MNVFNSNYVPSIISVGLLLHLQNYSLFMSLIIMCSALSVISITILIFVHWRKGSQCWLYISESVMSVLLYLNYLTIPLFIILMQVEPACGYCLHRLSFANFQSLPLCFFSLALVFKIKLTLPWAFVLPYVSLKISSNVWW